MNFQIFSVNLISFFWEASPENRKLAIKDSSSLQILSTYLVSERNGEDWKENEIVIQIIDDFLEIDKKYGDITLYYTIEDLEFV